jgi:hypothetical protein
MMESSRRAAAEEIDPWGCITTGTTGACIAPGAESQIDGIIALRRLEGKRMSFTGARWMSARDDIA